MRTQIFTDNELEELDSKFSPLSPQSLVEMVEIIRRKHYYGTSEPKNKFDFTKPPHMFSNYYTLWNYTCELNDYFGRVLFRPQAHMNIDTIIEAEISLNVYVREAVILQDKEARNRRKTVLYKMKHKIVGQKYEDAELERIFMRLNTPYLAKSMADYRWDMVNMAYYPKEMRLNAKLRKTNFDIKTGKPIEDLLY